MKKIAILIFLFLIPTGNLSARTIIYDNAYNRKGYIDGHTIYDKTYTKKGYIKKEKDRTIIYDDEYNRKGTLEHDDEYSDDMDDLLEEDE